MNEDKTNQQVDHDSFVVELIDLYGQQIQRIIYGFVKDPYIAEDLTQETFISAYEHLGEYRRDSKVFTWLYRIAVNKAKDYVKSAWFKRACFDFPKNIKSMMSTELTVIDKIIESEMIDKILALPIRYREVILLHYVEDLSVKEICEILSLEENTIRTRIRRGRKKLYIIYKDGSQNELF